MDNDLVISEIPYSPKLLNMHELLVEIKLENQYQIGDPETVTFRVSGDYKAVAHKICAANGVTLSDFLRKCCEQLVQEYA